MVAKYARGLPKQQDLFIANDPMFTPKLKSPEVKIFDTQLPETTKPLVRQTYRFIRYIGIGIALFSAFVSWINCFEWFKALRPIYVAIPMAVSMIGSSVLLPDFGIILARQKKKVMGGLIFSSGVIATLFCMVTTVAALYNTRSWTLQGNTSAAVAASTIDDSQTERTRILGEISRLGKLIDSTQSKIDNVPTEQTLNPESQTLQRRLNGYVGQKKEYEMQLSSLATSITSLRPQAQVIMRKDFYGFVAFIFKGDPGAVEFLTAVTPAVFLEIVAPIMVAMALFL